MERTDKPVYRCYLGGHHKVDKNWREFFNRLSDKMTKQLGFHIVGINPFNRTIDETDSGLLVARDVALITHFLTSYAVFYCDEPGAALTTGCTCEFMIACQARKPRIVISDPQRDKIYPLSGTKFNLWFHPFVEKFATVIVKDEAEAIRWIIKDIPNPAPIPNLDEMIKKMTDGFKFHDDPLQTG